MNVNKYFFGKNVPFVENVAIAIINAIFFLSFFSSFVMEYPIAQQKKKLVYCYSE
jgi:hypothetical protein